MPELRVRTVMLGSAALLAGCGQSAVPENKAAAVKAPASPGPEAVAQRFVRQRLGAGEVRFEEARAFHNDGVTIVCGTYSQPGRPHQRFVAVSDVDVWLEPEMAPGQMDRAFAEFCRDGSANA